METGLFSVHKCSVPAISALIGGIACTAYRTVCLRAMPLIALNLRNMAHFWVGNLQVPFMKPRIGKSYEYGDLRQEPISFQVCHSIVNVSEIAIESVFSQTDQAIYYLR